MKDNLTDELNLKIGKAILKAFVLGVAIGLIIACTYAKLS